MLTWNLMFSGKVFASCEQKCLKISGKSAAVSAIQVELVSYTYARGNFQYFSFCYHLMLRGKYCLPQVESLKTILFNHFQVQIHEIYMVHHLNINYSNAPYKRVQKQKDIVWSHEAKVLLYWSHNSLDYPKNALFMTWNVMKDTGKGSKRDLRVWLTF